MDFVGKIIIVCYILIGAGLQFLMPLLYFSKGEYLQMDREVKLALIGLAGTFVLAVKEIILAKIDKDKAIACKQ